MTKLDLFPPFICRAKSRCPRGREMSMSDIARASGLHRSTVITLSSRTSWDSIPWGTVNRFSQAGGIDMLALNGNTIRRLLLWRTADQKVNALIEQWVRELSVAANQVEEWRKNW